MEQQPDIQQRDADTLRVLGIFFSVMGALVLLGTFWAIGKMAAVIVSLLSGGILLAIGLGMWRYANRVGAGGGGDVAIAKPSHDTLPPEDSGSQAP